MKKCRIGSTTKYTQHKYPGFFIPVFYIEFFSFCLILPYSYRLFENRVQLVCHHITIAPFKFPRSSKLRMLLFSTLRIMELSANHITSQIHWTDLSLNRSTLEQLSHLKDSVKQQQAAITGEANKQFAGLPVLFYGPSETDKSVTAASLGTELGLEVHSINISEVISKHIGETEKNLDHFFALAADQGWILFFDEADALFGKRTESTNESDKFANQQVNYLFQRVEEYEGLVILSTNSKDNIDSAFIRRFHSVIHFPLSSATKKLNKNNPKEIPLE